MPGVFITQGMDLRISNLTIPLDGSDSPAITPLLRMDTWHHWMLIACDNTILASNAEASLQELLADDGDGGAESNKAKASALEAEFRAAMTVVAACAFAIDAYYAAIVERFGAHPDVAVWRKNGTPRHRQIATTFHYRLKLKGKGMPDVRQFLKQLFSFRDKVVHPPATFAEPAHREDIDAGIEPRFITYSAKHARRVIGLTVQLMTVLIDKASQLSRGDHAQWAAFANDCLALVRRTANTINGVTFPQFEAQPA